MKRIVFILFLFQSIDLFSQIDRQFYVDSDPNIFVLGAVKNNPLIWYGTTYEPNDQSFVSGLNPGYDGLNWLKEYSHNEGLSITSGYQYEVNNIFLGASSGTLIDELSGVILNVNSQGEILAAYSLAHPSLNVVIDDLIVSMSGEIICLITLVNSESSTQTGLISMDLNGNISWQRKLDIADNSRGMGLVELATGEIVASAFSANYYNYQSDSFTLIKTSSNGSIIWSKELVMPDSEPYSPQNILVDENDDIYISGFTLNFIDLQDRDPVVFKLDSEGSLIWSKKIDTSQRDQVYHCALMETGELIFGGVTRSFGPNNENISHRNMLIGLLTPSGLDAQLYSSGSFNYSSIVSSIYSTGSNSFAYGGYSFYSVDEETDLAHFGSSDLNQLTCFDQASDFELVDFSYQIFDGPQLVENQCDIEDALISSDNLDFTQTVVCGEPLAVDNPAHSNQVGVFPNPSSGRFYLMGFDEGEELILRSLDGRLLQKFQYREGELNFKEFMKGTYLISSQDSGMTVRVVIK